MNESNRLRRFAGKCLIVIVAVLLLCLFFSGTIKTLMTPKVRLTGVSNGRLRETITTTGYPEFTQTEMLNGIALPEGITLTVIDIPVRTGQYVRSGEVLLIAEVTGYTSRMNILINQYMETYALLLLHEQKNETISEADERWLQAYDLLLAAQENFLRLQADHAVTAAQLDEAAQQVSDAQATFNTAAQAVIDPAACAWRTEQRRMQSILEDTTAEMQLLKDLLHQCTVVAPHDGYIVSLSVHSGDVCTSDQPLLTMSGEGASCLLRGYVNSSRSISAGMTVTLTDKDGSTFRTRLASGSGGSCAEVDLDENTLSKLGGVEIARAGVPMSIQYVAAENTMQLPANAVRFDGQEYFVYLVEESENVFGTKVLNLRKRTVTVEGESAGMLCITGLSQNAEIAYMEDRTLNDGMEVMTYGSTP